MVFLHLHLRICLLMRDGDGIVSQAVFNDVLFHFSKGIQVRCCSHNDDFFLDFCNMVPKTQGVGVGGGGGWSSWQGRPITEQLNAFTCQV